MTRRLAPMAAGVLVAAGLIASRIACPDPFERVQLAVFDLLQRLDPWEPAESPVVVVDLDDESLRRVGQWPWPRITVAAMVTRLQEAGAAAIVFDAVFAEPDRTSPAALARDWTARFGWQSPAATLPDYDRMLADAFAHGRVVAGIGLVGDRNGVVPATPASFATIGGDPAATMHDFRGAVANLPAVEAAAAGVGSFSIVGEQDQVIRRLPLLAALNGRLIPSLALEALRVAQDEDTVKVRSDRDGGPEGPVTGYTVRVGALEMPLDRDGALRLHHAARGARTMLPAWRLLDAAGGAAAAAAARGRIVLIGTSALGLADLRATPLDPVAPGVTLHARGIEQVVAQHFLSRPSWASGVEIAAGLAMAMLMTVLAAVGPLRVALLGTGAAVIAMGAAAWLAFTRAGFLVDPSLAASLLAGSAVATGLARYFVAERDAARLRAAFKHYLSPDLVEALAREPGRLRLGGESRSMTFLFTDLEGFTALMESAEPAAAVALLNGYLDGLCSIAIEHGGTLDKIVGDALHVMFNAPLDQPDHASRAVRCALAMDGFAEAFRTARRAEGLAFGVTRIGINTGEAVVGNFGGSRRFDYTAHGDAINTAARLESANKALGTRICVAASTAAAASEAAFLPVGTLMLKGKAKGVDVLIPAGEGAGWEADYRAAIAGLAAGDETAALAILALHRRDPDHPILALHARRILAGERSLRMAA